MASSPEPPFLKKLADSLSQAKPSPRWVVLPNRRSLFVLKDMLSIDEATELITIDDLMQKLSGRQLIEPEELLVSFYAAYRAHEAQAQPFDQFSSWAVTFLSDVNDVDLHMVDLASLYQHIDEYHRTGSAFDPDRAGPVEQSFLSFWKRLPKYHATLLDTLEELKLGYRGLIYRQVAERAQAGDEALKQQVSGREVWWVGIIPGNPSERVLLDAIEEWSPGSVQLLADMDRYYIDAPHHEAGRLFRAFPLDANTRWATDQLAHSPKKLLVHPLPGKMVQVSRAREILMEIGKEHWNETVVVIPDASLLLPFIKVFHEDASRINVTSGFPMRATMIHRFVMSWMNLHAHAYERNGERYFYHKHLEEFLNYAVVQSWLADALKWEHMHREVVRENVRFIPQARLKEQMKGDLFAEKAYDLFFEWPGDPAIIFQKISDVLTQWAANTGRLAIAKIEQRAIQTYVDKLRLLLAQFNELLPERDVASLKRFVHRQVGYAKLFIEEPNNNALQVMGMLETRMIDFKHVIVLGASDDVLPGTMRDATHVPFIHRRHFKLPTRKETEALVAYHFYRLITRAERIDLIYDAVGDEMSSGEPSRFIVQLQEELLERNPDVSWSVKDLQFTVAEEDFKPLRVQKDQAVLEGVINALKQGLSPSALNKFIQSPLEFYYYYVLRLKEQDEVEEEIQANTFGSGVHKVLEDLYKPFEGKVISPTALEASLKEVGERVEAYFLTTFQEADLASGRNFILKDMAKQYIQSFIEFDLKDMRENGPVTLKFLEAKLMTELEVDGHTVRLKGIADRIDEQGGVTRVIDYKSGNVKSTDLGYDAAQLAVDPNKAKALQLAVYKYMYVTNHQLDGANVDSCILSMRNLSEGYMPVFPKKGEPEIMDVIEDVLKEIVRNMLDPTQAFEHREDSAYTTF